MFDKVAMRYKIALVWLLAFAGLWIIFQTTFPIKELRKDLAKIEQNVQSKDWEQARANTKHFIGIYKGKKSIIQVNNSTEAIVSFEHAIGQLKTAVEHEQNSAFEYIGGLKDSINFVLMPFAGP